ncbi:MAG: GcrA family cell cycle regulator [Alphaproteobacteria bacterium]
MSWTDERVALLKKLWGEGKTAAEIASTLGGVTRNAVIGKAHRLKLSNRMSPIQTNKKPKTPANTSKPPAAPVKRTRKKDIFIPKGKGLSLMELAPNMCRWPSGDPQEDDFGFCGELSAAGLPYCEDHARVAYQAARTNRVLKAEDFEDNKKRDDQMDTDKIVVNQ